MFPPCNIQNVIGGCATAAPAAQVRAAFFSEERFEKQQLAPQAGEFGEGS
jgi:hypothetical protein